MQEQLQEMESRFQDAEKAKTEAAAKHAAAVAQTVAAEAAAAAAEERAAQQERDLNTVRQSLQEQQAHAESTGEVKPGDSQPSELEGLASKADLELKLAELQEKLEALDSSWKQRESESRERAASREAELTEKLEALDSSWKLHDSESRESAASREAEFTEKLEALDSSWKLHESESLAALHEQEQKKVQQLQESLHDRLQELLEAEAQVEAARTELATLRAASADRDPLEQPLNESQQPGLEAKRVDAESMPELANAVAKVNDLECELASYRESASSREAELQKQIEALGKQLGEVGEVTDIEAKRKESEAKLQEHVQELQLCLQDSQQAHAEAVSQAKAADARNVALETAAIAHEQEASKRERDLSERLNVLQNRLQAETEALRVAKLAVDETVANTASIMTAREHKQSLLNERQHELNESIHAQREQELNQRLDDLQKSLEAESARVEALSAVKTAVEEEASQATANAIARENEAAQRDHELNKQLNVLQKSLEAESGRVEALSAAKFAVDEELAQATSKVVALEQELANSRETMESRQSDLQEKVDTLEGKLREAEHAASTEANQRKAQLQEKVDTLEGKLREAERAAGREADQMKAELQDQLMLLQDRFQATDLAREKAAEEVIASADRIVSLEAACVAHEQRERQSKKELDTCQQVLHENATLKRQIESVRAELKVKGEQCQGLQRKLREAGDSRAGAQKIAGMGLFTMQSGDAHLHQEDRRSGALYLQKIEELEAENARLEDQAHGGAALYVPKIQELEAEIEDVQLELQQALESQQALHQDLSAKTAIIHDLLRRCGLTANKGRIHRFLSAVPMLRQGQSSAENGEFANGGVAGGTAPLRIGELERALEKALVELAELGSRGGDLPLTRSRSGAASTAVVENMC